VPTTSPDGIYYPDAATSAAFEAALAQLAGSVQDAFDSSREDRQLQTFDWANSSERASQTGMTEGAIGYQRDTDVYYTYTGTIWAPLITPGGLVPIVPTSVAGTGVSVNTTTGLVTFTTASAANINGCFTSAFRNYRVLVDVPTTSTALDLTLRLRVSGADNSSAVYDGQGLFGTTATASAAATAAGTIWGLAVGARAQHAATLEFIAPQLSTRTAFKSETWSNDASGTNQGVSVRAGFHRTASGFDGFSLIASTGTMTGTLKIYGYN
jgi:hypothetical protein